MDRREGDDREREGWGWIRRDGTGSRQRAERSEKQKEKPGEKRWFSVTAESSLTASSNFTSCQHLRWPPSPRWPHGASGWTGQSLRSCTFSAEVRWGGGQNTIKWVTLRRSHYRNSPYTHTHWGVNSRWFMLDTTQAALWLMYMGIWFVYMQGHDVMSGQPTDMM